MSATLLSIFVDVLTFVSLAFLAVPAWHFNRYAQLSSKLVSLRLQIGVKVLDARRDALRKKAERLRDEWKPWKAWCLLLGTAAGALAALLALIDHIVRYVKS